MSDDQELNGTNIEDKSMKKEKNNWRKLQKR